MHQVLLNPRNSADAPAVKHLPSWMPFHRKAREGKAMIEHLVTQPFEHVKQEMVRARTP